MFIILRFYISVILDRSVYNVNVRSLEKVKKALLMIERVSSSSYNYISYIDNPGKMTPVSIRP